MTWENAANLTEKIRYLQDWTPASQRQKILERARSPHNRTLKALSEVHVRSSVAADSKKSLGDFFCSVPSLKEEISSLKKHVENLSNENSALRKSMRDVEDTLALTKIELADSDAKLADSDFAAAESRAKMAALDQDVEKLCELSKLLSQENSSLKAQIQERDLEINELKKSSAGSALMESLNAEKESLHAELDMAHKKLEAKERELQRAGGEICAMQKLVEELRLDREALHVMKEQMKVEKEVLHAEKEGLQADIIKALMQAKEERERLGAEKEKLEVDVEHAEKKAANEVARVAGLAQQVAELEEVVVEYQGEMKLLSEDLERAAGEAAEAKEKAAKLEAELAEERRHKAATPLPEPENLDVAQLTRQLSSLLFYRESSSEADHLVQVEFKKMTGAFSRGLLQVEKKISEWKEKMNFLEEGLAQATKSATSSEETASNLLSSFNAVTNVLKRPSPSPPLPPPRRRRASSSNFVPATAVASGALASGIYAFKLLRARSMG